MALRATVLTVTAPVRIVVRRASEASMNSCAGRLRWVAWCALVLCVVCLSGHRLDSHQVERIDVTVVDGRPLAAAVRELENRFGWVITYEDPPYEWPADVEDVTGAVSKSQRDPNRVLVPRVRAFVFEYPENAAPRDVLLGMLGEYQVTSAGDEFRLLESGSMSFHA
jgi:hypothetical protein